MAWVWAALAVYVAAFAAFWPSAFLIVDEERYVAQATAFAAGARVVPGSGYLHPQLPYTAIVDVPAGTSVLQAPFVWAFGWRGAALVSVISLIVATLATARWLRDRGREPAFALLIPGFFAAAFFGRIGMSDPPSMAVVAATCLLLWRCDGATGGRRRVLSLLAGLCAGVALSFREPLAVLLAPLLAGAMLRRRVDAVMLVAGGIAGLAVRLALAAWLFGDPLYVRDSGYGFSPMAMRYTIPVYAVVLLLMFPGGALLPLWYRGERRAELAATVAIYVVFFMCYDWNAIQGNGTAKGLILMSRFMIPLAPILAFMAADVWPRWYAVVEARVGRAAPLLARAAGVAAITVAAGVHPLAARQEAEARDIVSAVYSHTRSEIPVVTNGNATLKYLSPAYGPRLMIQRYDLSGDSLAAFAARYGTLNVVLMDRSDNEFFRHETRDNAVFLADVQQRCRVNRTLEHTVGGWAVVRVYDLQACATRGRAP